MMNDEDISLVTVLLAFVTGAVVGATIMALLAPQSGEETRGMLVNKGQDLKERAVDTTSNTGKAVSDLVSGARERATNLLHRGQEIGASIKSNIEEEAKSKSVQFGDR